MRPTEIRDLRQRLGLSQREFAIALGINADGARVVAGWEAGVRKGKPYAPSGSALMAMRYLEAMHECLNRFWDAEAIYARLIRAIPQAVQEHLDDRR